VAAAAVPLLTHSTAARHSKCGTGWRGSPRRRRFRRLSLEERRGCVWEGTRQSVGALEKGGGDGKSSSRRRRVVWSGGAEEEKERRRHEGDHTTKGLSEFFLFFN